MRTGIARLGVACGLAALLAGAAMAGEATLLGVRQGQLPNDTSGDVQLALEETAALGGIALKVVYAEAGSFGESRPKKSAHSPGSEWTRSRRPATALQTSTL